MRKIFAALMLLIFITAPSYSELQQASSPLKPIPRSSKPKSSRSFEKRSTDYEKVIKSYGLDERTEKELLEKHEYASKRKANREKSELYENLFNQYPYDYFAAYKRAESDFNMSRYGQASSWIERSLEVFPDYLPAKQLKKKIEGGLKQ